MKFCPHCAGDLSGFLAVASGQPSAPTQVAPRGKYDQTKVWRAIVERANATHGEPPDVAALAYGLARSIELMFEAPAALDTVIHIAFDRKIVPEGGALYQAATSGGRLGPTDLGYFKARGYLVEDDKVRVANDVPIGPVYGAIDYWGGAKQHHRWHMATPVKLNASRNGDPFFMDETMVAFGVTWLDGSKLGDAFMDLFETLSAGVKGSGVIARPLVAEAWIRA
jgi:hypothetical protein